MAHLVEKITTFFLWLLNILRQSKNFKGRWSLLVSLFPSSRFGISVAVAAVFEGDSIKNLYLVTNEVFQTFYWKRKNRELSKIKVFVTHNKSFYDPQNIALFSSGKFFLFLYVLLYFILYIFKNSFTYIV